MAAHRTLEPERWEFWHLWMQAQRLLTRELDRDLQQRYGITKAEFSVLVTLHQAPGGHLRVGELAESLDWEKSRVAHQLTRMENRELVVRTDHESNGRRAAIGLTDRGRTAVQDALLGHADNIRRHFFDRLSPDQAAAIHEWSRATVERLTTGPDVR
ncbi:MarR family winged helix-turn-helix transcriptional regulator [Actinoplanes sp. N902-109]|uniref:MarR family winged helix-turn-helix transcriptional regulator n=1 Tax=Actinoplanes sp. (strain N902-109) TaxID=649831 RepID=UPI000329618A|nr:MarR family transcriptional regulator [Actinoplanes sp. N902-109]AGL12190.1 transcriptional regulator, MarR family [Actinoplanes sp. N902-109]AGL16458.1 MarR family transcriptional regulatory protein [Actinoplanes sp. N902-109]